MDHVILYYYQIDPNIDNGDLRFYEYEEDKIPKKIFNPKSGDLVSFYDNIYHIPGNFTTKSKELVTSIFVKIWKIDIL